MPYDITWLQYEWAISDEKDELKISMPEQVV